MARLRRTLPEQTERKTLGASIIGCPRAVGSGSDRTRGSIRRVSSISRGGHDHCCEWVCVRRCDIFYASAAEDAVPCRCMHQIRTATKAEARKNNLIDANSCRLLGEPSIVAQLTRGFSTVDAP